MCPNFEFKHWKTRAPAVTKVLITRRLERVSRTAVFQNTKRSKAQEQRTKKIILNRFLYIARAASLERRVLSSTAYP